MREVKEKQPFRTPKTQDPLVRIPRLLRPVSGKIPDLVRRAEEIGDSSGEEPTAVAEQTAGNVLRGGSLGAETVMVKARQGTRELSGRFRQETDPSPRPSADSYAAYSGPDTAVHSPGESSGDTSSSAAPGTDPFDGRGPSAAEKAKILRSRNVPKSGRDAFPEENPTPLFRQTKVPNSSSAYVGQSPDRNPVLPVYDHSADVQETSPSQVRTVKRREIRLSQKPVKAVRLSERTVKTAARTVKDVRREAKAAVKASQKTAKAAEKAAKTAKETAVRTWQAGIRAAKIAAKAIEAAIRAIIEAAKELGAMIASGGWAAAVALSLIGVIAVVVGSCFGLFWSDDVSSGSPMSAVISSVDRSWHTEIDKAVRRFGKEIEHDEIEVEYKGDNNDGDSVTVNNWNDVLAVFAVFSSTGDDPKPLIEVTDDTESRLREVFYAMNTVTFTYSLKEEVPEDAPAPTPDEEGNVPKPDPVTVLVVEVHQKAMTYKEAAKHFGFTETQTELLEEMMSPAYYGYYAKLIGVDVLGGTDYTQIVSNLPFNSKGAEVVKAALTRLGCPYLMGAKGSTKFDCSGLAYWSIKQVDPELGDRMYTNAAGQAKYCYDRGLTVGRSELQPGDLIFWVNKKCEGCHRWKEIHHVGIYIGDGKAVEAASGKGRVLIRDLWETKNYPILMFGRPYQ